MTFVSVASSSAVSLEALSAARRQAWDGLDAAELEFRWSAQSRVAAAAQPGAPTDFAADPSTAAGGDSILDASLAEILDQVLAESAARAPSASSWWSILQE